MTQSIDTQSPLGSYAPNAVERFALSVARALPFARGFVRKRVGLWVGRDKPVDIDLFDLKVRCYPGQTASERRAIMDAEAHDREERDAILAAAKAKAEGAPFNFLDVGANCGFYTLHLAANAKNARILALEPVARYVQMLRFNLTANQLENVVVEQVAASDREGEAIFDPLDQSLATPNLSTKKRTEEPYAVRTKPLLDCCRDAGFETIDALKIDVEGFEDKVLFPFFANAPKTMWPRLVVIEHSCLDAWQDDCLKLLDDSGYRPQWKGRLNTVYVLD